MVGIIEETKDISEMSVQELMGSLKAYEERLLKQSGKPLESAFKSKVNLNSKSYGELSSNEQTSGESSRGFSQGRGRGRRRNSSRGRGRSNIHRSSSVEENTRKYRVCERGNHLENNCWF